MNDGACPNDRVVLDRTGENTWKCPKCGYLYIRTEVTI